jgi:predicted PurR-regulated permease PerM
VSPEGSKARSKSAWIASGVLLVASIALMCAVFSALWQALLLGAVLATATHGVYRRLAGRLGDRTRLAAVLMTLGVVVLLLAPLVVIGTVVVREMVQAYEYVRDAMREGGIEELLTRLPNPVGAPVRRALRTVDVSPEAIVRHVTEGGVHVSGPLSDALSSAATLLFGISMVLVAYFALLLDGKRLLAWIEELSPLQGRQTVELFAQFTAVSRSVLRSQVLTAAAQATVAMIGYRIAGVPSVVFFGFLTFLVAFIPVVGTGVVALPLAALLLVLGNTWQAVFLAVWAVLVVGVVDNLLKPLLIRDGIQAHGVLILFSLIGGLLVFGGIGLLVGPLAVTFFLTMIRFYRRDFGPGTAPT